MEKQTTHAVFFDGITYYIDDIESHQDDKVIIVFSSIYFEKCEKMCYQLNNNNK